MVTTWKRASRWPLVSIWRAWRLTAPVWGWCMPWRISRARPTTLPHGVCNAILLPIIENFNRPNAVARFARVAQAMGVDTRGMSDEAASMSAIQAIRDLSARVGIPSGFSQLGVTKADIEGWLDKALADPCAPCNPRTASRDEVRELYLEAL